MNFARFSVGV